jgi:hypothetical protein
MILFGKILYSILSGYGILMKLLLNVYKRNLFEARVGKHLYAALPIQNGMQWGDALLPLLLTWL